MVGTDSTAALFHHAPVYCGRVIDDDDGRKDGGGSETWWGGGPKKGRAGTIRNAHVNSVRVSWGPRV